MTSGSNCAAQLCSTDQYNSIRTGSLLDLLRDMTNLKHILVEGITVLLCLFLAAYVWAQPFAGMSDAIEQGDYGNVKAAVISRHGEIIYEGYFRGTQADDLHEVHSVTKSIGSALIGIAHRQGRIRLDQDLTEFFGDLYPMSQPPYANKQSITVEAILQQRHGIEWDEWSLDYSHPQNPVQAAIRSGDWYDYILRRPMDARPGEKFTYSTIGSTLMSRMIRYATGQSAEHFASLELFDPLGIESFRWAFSGVNDTGNQWPNPDNDVPLGMGLWLNPRDMLKIGELYLNGGLHNGRRILDQSWVDASWAAYSNSNNTEIFADSPGSGYGYQWWTRRITDDLGRTWAWNYAVGWARQYIQLIPELNLVLASVADDYDYDGPGIGALLQSFILPELSPILDRRFNGAWYDPETDGQGLTLEVLKEGARLIGFWYTYGENGGNRWFTFDGDINGSTAVVSIIQTSGGAFLQGDPVTRSEWGTGRFSVFDCDHITFEINSPEVTSSVPLTRLTGSCSAQ